MVPECYFLPKLFQVAVWKSVDFLLKMGKTSQEEIQENLLKVKEPQNISLYFSSCRLRLLKAKVIVWPSNAQALADGDDRTERVQ